MTTEANEIVPRCKQEHSNVLKMVVAEVNMEKIMNKFQEPNVPEREDQVEEIKKFVKLLSKN